MSIFNIEHRFAKKVPYIILMRIGNGEVVEIMIIETPSIKECREREFAAMRLMNPNIMKKNYNEHFIFEDMLSLVDMQELMPESDSIN